jgi:hypothetical protein
VRPRVTAVRLTLIALGVSISEDELATGFTIGLAHLAVTAVIVSIAAQAFLAAPAWRGPWRKDQRALA